MQSCLNHHSSSISTLIILNAIPVSIIVGMLAPLLSSTSFFWPSLSCEFKIAGKSFSHRGHTIKEVLEIATKRLASPPFRAFPPSTKCSTCSYFTFCILGSALRTTLFSKNTSPKAFLQQHPLHSRLRRYQLPHRSECADCR